MTYDESIYRRRNLDSTDGADDGYQTDGGSGRVRAVPPAILGDIFDDPRHGEPGRDRIGIHIVWEVVLLVGVAVLGFLVHREDAAVLRGSALTALLISVAALGLLTLGAGLTLRAAAPNLALGPVAIAAALHFAENGDQGVVQAMWPAAVAAAALGAAVAILVVGFHVPSWAATLAAALGVIVLIQQRTAPVAVRGGFDPARSAWYLVGGFAAVAVLGGLFGTIKAVRRSVGRFRPVADPAHRRGATAAVLTTGAIVVSMVLALLAGVLLAAGGSGPVRPTTGIEWTGLAIGAALLAGTSAFGRRGGIFGTVLAVVLVTLFITYADIRSWHIALGAIAAGTVAAGLVVTRLVESFGRPRSAVERDDDWAGESTTVSTATWSTPQPERPESWSASLPAQRAEPQPDPWGTDRWGTGDR